jgi:UDP-N-acetylglucosamine 2-epimerase (non-hydrolysing)
VGTEVDRIVTTTRLLLDDKSEYERMTRVVTPYGDGFASDRIAAILRTHYVDCKDNALVKEKIMQPSFFEK